MKHYLDQEWPTRNNPQCGQPRQSHGITGVITASPSSQWPRLSYAWGPASPYHTDRVHVYIWSMISHSICSTYAVLYWKSCAMKSSFFEVLKGIREKGQSSADIYVLNWIDFIYDLFDIVHHLVHRFCDICEWNGQKLQVKVSKCCHYHPCWEEQYKTFFHLCVTNYQLPTYYEHPLIHHSTLADPKGVAVRQPRSATVAGLHHPPPQQCRTWDALGKRCKGTMNILQGPPCMNIKAKEILNWAIATISVEITQIPAW